MKSVFIPFLLFFSSDIAEKIGKKYFKVRFKLKAALP